MRTSDLETSPSELKVMPWGEYRSKAVSASSIGEYWYCSAKVLNARLHGRIETEETETGSGYHEEETTKVIGALGPLRKIKVESVYDVMKLSHDNIRNALKGRKVLANSETTVLFWAIHPERKYIGVPESRCTNGKEPILMDFKTTGRLPHEAWIDHRTQLGAYMLGIERLGFRQSYGIVRYVLRSKQPTEIADFKVYLDDNLRLHVSTTSDAVHKVLDGGSPQPTKNLNKCRACAYDDLCRWSLTRVC
jgi:CRISPR/Cas system-associated exonuclease Cas4 (RecB family)